MRLLQLQYFQALANYDDLAAASRSLGVSKSALSRTIVALETELETQLFSRSQKRMKLNRQGEIFLPYIVEFSAYLNSAVRASRECNALSERSLSVALMTFISKFPLFLLEFKKQYPEITLDILQKASNVNSKALSSYFDLTIFASEFPHNQKNVALLFQENIMLAVSLRHPLANRSSIMLSELADQPVFLPPKSNTTFINTIQHYFQSVDFSPHTRVNVDSIDIIKSFVRTGTGVTLLPCRSWIDENDGDLALIPLNPPCKRYINIGWHEDYYMTTASRQFKDFLITHANDIF